MMDFPSYLQSKKIEAHAFQQSEPSLFHEWKTLYEQVSPESFTAQKLFLINPIRRKYPLVSPPAEASQTMPAARPKVIIKPKKI
jgi:hypothetical protein